ncbi:MAG: hypothetical protein V8R98_02325 [Holdemanella sp.]
MLEARNVPLDVAIEGVGGLLTRIAFGVRVQVFIGCTRLAGSDYPMDTKFLMLSMAFEEDKQAAQVYAAAPTTRQHVPQLSD